GVEIISALDVDYEKILTESSLMITDYSGVQFDFAYMRKPVVYYHPDELPPHYKEGGFFYDTMGFGEICTKHEEIVALICEYMENDCAIKPLYADRQNDFFAFNDLNSCKRIYDDMLEFQRVKRSAIRSSSTQSMKEVQK
ncbi:CDP-glycerol glycerophosphotransferase family protein, partial [Shinella sp. M27]|uniref:CDP-glycerol glycerophosphotransferase family protein n=1 Tax=Shinella sp. M27 TaxID=3368614 RepID=UPI003BA14BA6